MRRGKIEVSRQLGAGMPAGVFAGMFIVAAWLLASCAEHTGVAPPGPEDASGVGAARSEGERPEGERPEEGRGATGAPVVEGETAWPAAAPEGATKRAAFGDYVVSGPYAHANLAVYLVHGEDRIKGKSFLTLEEALAKKLAILHETGNVSKLAIENVSLTEEVYVQSGDIVKGGKQDRVIAHDFIVPAKSGKMPIASFCVERGRWSRRGGEPAGQFSASTMQLATKGLKLAAKKSGSQTLVWREVSNAQTMISGNLQAEDYQEEFPASGQGADRPPAEARQVFVNVQFAEQTEDDTAAGVGRLFASESPTSLQLTLENKKVKEAAAKYTKALSGIIGGHDDATGFAFAINGEANSADLYASRALFRKLWPKLLGAAAVEAVAELKKDAKVAHPAAEKLVAELFTKLDEEGEKVAVSEKEITRRVRMKTKESAKVILFETLDAARPGAPVHSNYMAH